MDLTLGLGVSGMGIVAGILLVLGLFGDKVGIPDKPAGWLKTFGVVGLIFAIIVAFGVVQSEEKQTVVEDQPTFEVSVSESDSHVTYDSTDRMFTIAVSFNDTSDAFVSQTGYMEANFTVYRTDALLKDAVVTAELGNVGIIDVAGASNEYILDENADGTFKAKWTKANSVSTWEDATLLVEQDNDASNYIVLNITLNADAVAEMSQYGSTSFSFDLAGYDFSVNIIKATVST